MSRVLTKVCGITRLEDVRVAQEAGADYFGMVYSFPKSPRCVNHDQARTIFESVSLPAVLVTVNMTIEELQTAADRLSPYALQLHGDETTEHVSRLKQTVACQVWKVIHVPPGQMSSDELRRAMGAAQAYVAAGCDAMLIDTSLATATDEKRYGGTGLTGDWEAIREIARALSTPTILTGGLQPENVEEAIRIVQPAGVDVSSGVEQAPGLKDPERIRSFLWAVRRAESARTVR